MSFEDFVNGLPTEIEGRRAAKVTHHYPCGQCAGTGKWSGGTNRHGNDKCLACQGRGFFTTSPDDRAKHRAAARAKVEAKAEETRRQVKQFAEEHPDMWVDLVACRTDFTASLYASLTRWGSLTQNQIAAWYRGHEKLLAARAARNSEAEAKGGVVDLSPIRAMFDTAVQNGQRKPIYRAEGLKLSLAPATGKNAGCLYVVEIEEDAYQGKIDGTDFKAVREAKADTLSRLQRIAANPLEAAVAYGRKTGVCSCCGRELTNQTSVEMGIGPICASKWGF